MNELLSTNFSSDESLWERFKTGDRKAFEQIISLHYASLFRFGSRYSKDTGLIEDCLHDMFVYIWERRTHISGTDSIKKYLLKSFRHKILLELQRTQRRGWVDEDEALDHAPEQNFEEFVVLIETEQLSARKIKTLIDLLPQRQQEALHLRYFEELDIDTIAQVMSINRQSVSNHLHKALNFLREHW
ncbi:sigma-70 family RNA polymerase sigma factor [Spirosoma terrae]|uniref:Sigma-70 family RNA polymerase sigma factor n=1 Tax=Spirosoma terrae TaxID=1968276 RepID=A0A6L9L2N0_9BACT|nr:sigma-70 family RNA polymerase sigma factor [Spirosoma terrae]NDU93657.1 sigma-70 family RNA polymerase sigma factor [Spirosoma terrae]